jgi:hypothetical protein
MILSSRGYKLLKNEMNVLKVILGYFYRKFRVFSIFSFFFIFSVFFGLFWNS